MADIRWLNLGPSERGGATRMIAGQEVTTPLFDTCRHCGIVPLAQRGVRERAEARHRGWCRQRKEPDPDGWTSLALTHELRTQAVRLLVPPIALVDRTVRASFRAALLLGLREVLGGDPDHLDVVEATDPAGSSERWVMVLHDLVPGGTGYLARFVDPDRVRELLGKALTVLRSCPCREEGVAACHRCLLPHVAPHQADDVRRTVAIDLLDEVLAHWEPRPIETITRITPDLHDTPIEKRFRTLLLRWAKARGAALTVTATAQGDSATIHFPQALGDGRWQLVPQVKLGGVMPDFVLTSPDTQVPKIAVFCDSRRWHCSPEANRLADDTDKRAGLRDQDYLVWALTHRDLDAFATVLDGKPAPPPSWLGDPLRSMFVQVAQKVAAPGSVKADALLTDAVSVLTVFLLRPSRTAWQSPAHALGLTLCHRADAHKIGPTSVAALLRTEFGEDVEVPAGPAAVVTCRSPHGAVVAVDRRSVQDVRPWVAVDDRDDAVGTPQQLEAWHDWLALTNVLQFVEPGRFHAVTSSGLLAATAQESAAERATTLSPGWQEIADVSEGASLDLVRAVAGLGVPVPEAGHEVDDGEYVVDLAWPERRIAVSVEVDDDRNTWLAAHGWTVAPPDAAAIRAAMEGAR